MRRQENPDPTCETRPDPQRSKKVARYTPNCARRARSRFRMGARRFHTVTLRALGDLLRRAGDNHGAASVTAVGAHVDDAVPPRVNQVVLDHRAAVCQSTQALQHVELAHVLEAQRGPGGGLVIRISGHLARISGGASLASLTRWASPPPRKRNGGRLAQGT